jgi:hypothetical protein
LPLSNSTVRSLAPDQTTSGCCPPADSTHVSCPHAGSTLPSLVLRRLTTLGLLSPGKLNPSVSCSTSGSHDWLHCLALAPQCLLDRSTRECWYDGPSAMHKGRPRFPKQWQTKSVTNRPSPDTIVGFQPAHVCDTLRPVRLYSPTGSGRYTARRPGEFLGIICLYAGLHTVCGWLLTILLVLSSWHAFQLLRHSVGCVAFKSRHFVCQYTYTTTFTTCYMLEQ